MKNTIVPRRNSYVMLVAALLISTTTLTVMARGGHSHASGSSDEANRQDEGNALIAELHNFELVGTAGIQNVASGECMVKVDDKVGTTVCAPGIVTTGLAQDFDLYKLKNGSNAICQVGTVTNYRVVNTEVIEPEQCTPTHPPGTTPESFIPPDFEEKPLDLKNPISQGEAVVVATCTPAVTAEIVEVGYQAVCLVRKGKNRLRFRTTPLSRLVDRRLAGGGFEQPDVSHWKIFGNFARGGPGGILQFSESDRLITRMEGLVAELRSPNGPIGDATQHWTIK